MVQAREKMSQEILEKLGCLFHGVNLSVRMNFNKLDLRRAQVTILFIIARSSEPVSMKELAKKLNVTNGAITQLIDGLESKKLIERQVDAKDRRLIRIKLARSTQATFKKIKKSYAEKAEQIFAVFNDSELVQLDGLLGKLNRCNDSKICLDINNPKKQ